LDERRAILNKPDDRSTGHFRILIVPLHKLQIIGDFMPVSDPKVRLIVDQAMGRGLRAANTCCGQTEIAFRDLQAQRRLPGKSLDLDLAAAEHYLFARWMVCTGTVSPNQMRTLVIGYDAKKLIDKWRSTPNKLQTTPNPVSPPDSDVVGWGLRGADDGSADHDRCNASVRAPMWRSLDDIFKPQ
jgi:hypothetical protein